MTVTDGVSLKSAPAPAAVSLSDVEVDQLSRISWQDDDPEVRSTLTARGGKHTRRYLPDKRRWTKATRSFSVWSWVARGARGGEKRGDARGLAQLHSPRNPSRCPEVCVCVCRGRTRGRSCAGGSGGGGGGSSLSLSLSSPVLADDTVARGPRVCCCSTREGVRSDPPTHTRQQRGRSLSV